MTSDWLKHFMPFYRHCAYKCYLKSYVLPVINITEICGAIPYAHA